MNLPGISTAKGFSCEKPFAVDVGCEREGYGWLSPLYKNTADFRPVIGG